MERIVRNRSETKSFGTQSREGHDASAFYKRKIYAKQESIDPPTFIEKNQPVLDTIYCHDSSKMIHLPDSSIDLMITSPPYNVGKDYDDDLSLAEYLNLIKSVMQETYRVLVDGGRACVNIANIGRKPYIPLHSYIMQIAIDCGFLMRGEIIWDKGASAGSSCAWGSWKSASNPSLRDVHEYILIFSKNTYGKGKKGTSTISKDEFLQFTKSIWTFPSCSAKKAQHPAPFPIELPRRLIELYSYEADTVLDPFMGGGTTALAAIESGRHYIGYELSQEYVDISESKIKKLL